MPKVSVIVPVYGVERYIERCAKSLFEQSLEDMEFIFVDDCTTDQSIKILENTLKRYPLREQQTKILHHKYNKGLSHARETGITEASGEYIAHCDSDDWVEVEMYETMYNFAKSNGYDYVKCAHRKTNGKGTGIVCHSEIIPNMSSGNTIRLMLQLKGWNSVWDSLVSHGVYEMAHPIFTENAMFEDFFLTSQLLLQAKKIGYIDEPWYNYFVNPDSICNTPSAESYVKRAIQAKANVEWVLQFLHDKTTISETDIVTIKWAIKNILIPIMDTSEYRSLWDELYPELKNKVILTKTISVRNKLRFYAAEFNLYKYLKR